MKYDLHTHTIFSDGELTVDGNVNIAIERGLDGIAISDHDNLEAWKLIDNNKYPIPVIKAVELSTYYNNENVHILGYYLNNGKSYKELEDFLSDLREKRKSRTMKMINLLEEQGIYITYEEVLKHADGAIARPHVAQAIIDKYPEKNYTIQDIFDLYIGDDKPAYVKTSNFQTVDAIKLLHNNNCLAVLAHPLNIKKQDYKEVLNLDLDGVECYYPYEDKEKDYQEVIEEAKKRNLIITGGSDFHGPTVRNTMGRAYLEGEELDTFLRRINK